MSPSNDDLPIFTDEIEVWREGEWQYAPFGTLRRGERFRHTNSASIPLHIVLICDIDAEEDKTSIFGYRVVAHKESG